jgi:RimJ/RimL family protein N-acetyltransferase
VSNNDRSQKVLLRAGFEDVGVINRDGKEYRRFERKLG